MDCETEINENKSIIDYKRSLDHTLMMRYIEVFSMRYPFMEILDVGSSFMGRRIPVIALGRGDGAVMYVGAGHGGDWMTSIILLRFINEYCELYRRCGRIYNNTLETLYSTKRLYVVPMLNPDGVDYAINGISDKNMLYDKLCSKGDGFDTELGSLCNFLRFNPSVRALISIHLGREGICCSGSAKFTRALTVARCLSRMTGYGLESSTDISRSAEPCMREIDIPTFMIKCGDENKSFSSDVLFKLYTDVREALFSAPFII